uniref:Uncharacterized protein n=1 Tax=Aegilops tauschii subsp. strangulata TaxID=200361 RepID=A0A453JIP8_AEGTS
MCPYLILLCFFNSECLFGILALCSLKKEELWYKWIFQRNKSV